MVPRKMSTYAQTVNDYVNARRTRSHTDLATLPALVQLPKASRHTDPEWTAMLQQYHRELDKLREDWALEVLGRKMVQIIYFQHLIGRGIYCTEWPSQNTGSIKTLPKRLKTRFRSKKESLWAYWELHVKQGLWPLRWGPLQDRYMRLQAEIDHKYCTMLGLFGPTKLSKNR